MVFTAPYGDFIDSNQQQQQQQYHHHHRKSFMREFFIKHGLAVRAVCIEVDDVYEAYQTIISYGGMSVTDPRTMSERDNNSSKIDMAEVQLYGDVILRLINLKNYQGSFLPSYQTVERIDSMQLWSPVPVSNDDSSGDNVKGNVGYYGIERFDHIVGNLWSLEPTMSLLRNMTVSLTLFSYFHILLS